MFTPPDKPLFTGRTLNFAHRGFTRSAPENSLAAFRAAMELGVDGIELDVRTCKSGEVVVFHDPTLARMTDGRGFVKNKTLSELQALRLKGAEDERIPTLAETIELTKGRVLLNVEIKTNGLPKNSIEQKVVDILRAYGVAHQTLISSFNPLVLRRIRRIDATLLTGYLVDRSFTIRSSEVPLSRLAGAKALHLQHRLARAKLADKIKRLGLGLVVWSVNAPEEMRAFLQMGVDVIITDRPDLLRSLIEKR